MPILWVKVEKFCLEYPSYLLYFFITFLYWLWGGLMSHIKFISFHPPLYSIIYHFLSSFVCALISSLEIQNMIDSEIGKGNWERHCIYVNSIMQTCTVMHVPGIILDRRNPFELEGHKLAPRFPINVENMQAAPPSRWGSIKCGGKGRLESIHKESMGALFGSKIDKRTVINKGQVRLLLW